MAVVAEESGAGDGDARAGGAGDEGDGLPDADDHGVGQGPVLLGAGGLAELVGPVEQDAEDQHRPGDHRDRAQVDVEPGELEDQAEGDDRHGGDQQEKGEFRPLGIGAAQEEAGQAEHGLAHVGPEIDQHGEEGAHVDGDVDGLALILQAGEVGEENQVAGGGDRQEFRKPLNQGDDDEVEEGHRRNSGG